jgi:hypothetical protein
MKVRITLIIITLAIIGGLYNQNVRWLVFNGLSASNYSKSLIKGETVKTPDWNHLFSIADTFIPLILATSVLITGLY